MSLPAFVTKACEFVGAAGFFECNPVSEAEVLARDATWKAVIGTSMAIVGITALVLMVILIVQIYRGEAQRVPADDEHERGS